MRAQINEYRQFCAATLASASAKARAFAHSSAHAHAHATAALAAIVERAACIYFMYVQPQRAVYEINIASPTLKKIRDALGYGMHGRAALIKMCTDQSNKDRIF